MVIRKKCNVLPRIRTSGFRARSKHIINNRRRKGCKVLGLR